MEKININERIFAVKVKTGEKEYSWAICLRWSFNYDEPVEKDEDFQLMAIDKDLSKALITAIKRIDEYSFKIENKLINFLDQITYSPDLKIERERECFQGCSQICFHENEYGLLSDEFEICRG